MQTLMNMCKCIGMYAAMCAYIMRPYALFSGPREK